MDDPAGPVASRPPGLAERLRLYVVTSARPSHLRVIRAALEGGATAVQLRAPELAGRPEELIALGREAAEACRARGVLFVLNDDPGAAAAAGADAVHVGQGDDPPGVAARRAPGLLLGVSVGSVEEANAAEALGASYLGVTVWGTPTKPEAKPAGLAGLRRISSATRLPVVGIGGIDAGNAAEVIRAGAAGVAVVSAVAAAEDPVAATRTLVEVVRRAVEAAGPRDG